MTRKCVTDEQYGQLCRRAGELIRRVDEGTLPFDETFSELQRLIERQKTNKVFTVMVNYDLPLKEMIKAGEYDWVNSDITQKYFPVKGNGQAERELILVHFGRSMSSDKVLNELTRQGLKPAKIEDLLALGSLRKELQRKFPIIAFGSVWTIPDGYRFVTYLSGRDSERRLDLYWYDLVWGDICRFLASRK